MVRKHITSDLHCQSNDSKKMTPTGPGPDRGFAWVVALACFLINFIMAGLARSAGVLYVALIESYGVSREAATTPFSIRICVRNMTGPVIGMLGQRYGIRIITVIGGLVAALGGILCYFAPDIFWITILWGIIHGLGFGLSTILHMVSINQHFDKYRATALGIGFSGDCIGTFVLPIVIDFLLNDFGIRGTFLVIGGIVLNVIPLAMLLRPPSWQKNVLRNVSSPKIICEDDIKSKQNRAYDNKGFSLTELNSINDTVCRKVKLVNDHIPSYEEAVRSTSSLRDEKHLTNNKSIPEVCDKELAFNVSDKNCNISFTEPDSSSVILNKRESENTPWKQEELKLTESINHSNVESVNMTTAHEVTANEMGNVSILQKSDGLTEIVMESIDLNHNSVVKTTITEHCESGIGTVLRIRTLSESRRLGILSNENRNGSLNQSATEQTSDSNSNHLCKRKEESSSIEICQEVKFRNGNVAVIQNPLSSSITISYENEENSRSQEQSTIEVDTLPTVSRVSGTSDTEEGNISTVMRNALAANLKPMFVLISLTMAVYAFLFVAVLTVIIDFGVDKGISEEYGKFLIIGFSATDLVGRLAFGVIIDRRWISLKHYVAFTVGVMGCIVAFIPAGSGFLILMIFMGVFGLVQGGAAIMFPILVNSYMEKDEESIAMGCLNFYAGLLMLGMAPMIGFFRDRYGTYDNIFLLVGLSCVIVGLIWLLEPFILRWQNSRSIKSEKPNIHNIKEVTSIESNH